MYLAIRLSFVLALMLCLAGKGKAGMIDADRNRIQQLQVMSRQTTDVDTQVRLAYEAIGIFNKYKGQSGSHNAREAQLNTQVQDFKRKTMVVDGVPAQGGVWDTLKTAAGSVPDNVKRDAQNLLKSSSKALVEGITNYLVNTVLSKIGLTV
ncbi:protein Turandot Z [Drosophila eugracilis]|uniref:protein Turandot Z n=1 Tax=Drosophila eugracilis TaxID=29029 RepID=UPI001BDAD520|nr:protein Turandot Z [Drosophila eugracilis]